MRCAAALKQQPDAAVEETQQLVLSGAGVGNGGRIFTLQQLHDEATFLAAQMTALHQVGTVSKRQAAVISKYELSAGMQQQ